MQDASAQNLELSGNLEVSETTTINDLSVSGAVDIDTHTYFNTIVIRRPTVFSVDAIFFKGWENFSAR